MQAEIRRANLAVETIVRAGPCKYKISFHGQKAAHLLACRTEFHTVELLLLGVAATLRLAGYSRE